MLQPPVQPAIEVEIRLRVARRGEVLERGEAVGVGELNRAGGLGGSVEALEGCAPEGEELVFDDWAAEGEAILMRVVARLGDVTTGEDGLGAARLAVDGVEAGAGVDLVHAAVEAIGAVLGDLVDNGSAGAAELGAGVVEQRGDAGEEVGQDRLDGLAAESDVIGVLAIDHEVVGAWASSVDGELDEAVATDAAEILYGDVLAGDAGHLADEVGRIEREDGNLLQLLLANGSGELAILSVDGVALSFH
jgi:hypothetical protein